MPIYEFYCDNCNTIFNFFSRKIKNQKSPTCPKCDKPELQRKLTTFATLSGKKEENDQIIPGMDEAKVEKAISLLAQQAGNINEDDPKQAVGLMRKFSEIAGVRLSSNMEEALTRIESGENPEQVESDMGDLMEGEDPFTSESKSGKSAKHILPITDETLYDL